MMEIGPSQVVVVPATKHGRRRVQCGSGSESIARYGRPWGSWSG